MKTLSIIIPIYNTSKEYFSKCLTSLICDQSYEIEVIVIDDGSLSALDMIRAFDLMLEQLDIEVREKYHTELEWLAILHVLYYNTERILKSFNGNKIFIKKIRSWLKLSYPNWRNNPYLKTEPITRSASFILIKIGCPMLLQILRKIKGKLKNSVLYN